MALRKDADAITSTASVNTQGCFPVSGCQAWRSILPAVAAVVLLGGCDRLPLPELKRPVDLETAAAAAASGDEARAVQLYEEALDGTIETAEAHYRLGLLYEDKLRDHLAALHHFRRYLALSPEGHYAREVKQYTERLHLQIANRYAEGGVLPATEAARLRNENLALRKENQDFRKELAELRSGRPGPRPVAGGSPEPAPVATAKPAKGKPEPPTAPAVASTAPPANPAAPSQPFLKPAAARNARTYTVQKGDTLAAISRKFYKTSARWKDIAEANKEALKGTVNLQIGQQLVIPQ